MKKKSSPLAAGARRQVLRLATVIAIPALIVGAADRAYAYGEDRDPFFAPRPHHARVHKRACTQSHAAPQAACRHADPASSKPDAASPNPRAASTRYDRPSSYILHGPRF